MLNIDNCVIRKIIKETPNKHLKSLLRQVVCKLSNKVVNVLMTQVVNTYTTDELQEIISNFLVEVHFLLAPNVYVLWFVA